MNRTQNIVYQSKHTSYIFPLAVLIFVSQTVVADEAAASEKIANKNLESNQGDTLMTTVTGSEEDLEVQVEEGPGNLSYLSHKSDSLFNFPV